MKLLIFSDSHGCIENVTAAVNRSKGVDIIIHLGDLVKDAQKLQAVFKELKIEFVAGNNDLLDEIPKEKLILVENKKIFITHGDKYRVKNGYDTIISRGIEVGGDIILFGHTHKPYENYHNNILILNPGSISLPAQGYKPSYGILEITKEAIKSEICTI